MPNYGTLPAEVVEICRSIQAPPRLVAHLTLVHDVAGKLVRALQLEFPGLEIDTDLVLFGAATHDIGKSLHSEELSGPGSKHEREGSLLLRKSGVSEERARFAVTHANWMKVPDIKLEDLLVALADNCWKGKRLSELENEVVRTISSRLGKEPWAVFAAVDGILDQIAADADVRLAWAGTVPGPFRTMIHRHSIAHVLASVICRNPVCAANISG